MSGLSGYRGFVIWNCDFVYYKVISEVLKPEQEV